MVIKIWGRYKKNEPEVIDEADNQKTADYLVGEYRMAYGRDWIVWAGRKRREDSAVAPTAE